MSTVKDESPDPVRTGSGFCLLKGLKNEEPGF